MRITVAITLLVTLFVSAAQAQPVSQRMAPTLIGTWQVTTVHIDSGASRTLHYHHNDRRLVGRIFWISQAKINTNTPESDRCETPKATKHSYKLDRLIQESMAGRSLGPERPTAADYGLLLPKEGIAEVLSLQCRDRLWGASLGREDGIQGAWIVKQDENRLALRWYDETILELSRLSPNTRPKASYGCHLAGNPAEKTICGSVDLALLDVSIADAYAAALKRLSENSGMGQQQALKLEQRSWMSKRNQCATNVVCLQEAMSTRLEALEAID